MKILEKGALKSHNQEKLSRLRYKGRTLIHGICAKVVNYFLSLSQFTQGYHSKKGVIGFHHSAIYWYLIVGYSKAVFALELYAGGEVLEKSKQLGFN